MSVHFILDGYNIINQANFLKSGSLKGSRDKLCEFILSRHPQGSPKNKITIVFDGREDVDILELPSALKIFFSKGEDADSCIKNLVVNSANPKTIVVVSDDRELQFSVKRSGARIMPVKEFLAKGKYFKAINLDNDRELSFYKANKITSELKNFWLKDK